MSHRYRFASTLILSLLLAPGLAHAAGFKYPENGAKALAQGGAFTADPTDATALYFNPAGLSGQQGLQVLVDGHFIWLNSTFQRQGADGSNVGNLVENDYAPFIAPFVGVSYGLMENLTLAAGIYGPSAYGTREFPDPRDVAPALYNGDPSDDAAAAGAVSEQAPQRYGLISSEILVFYPSLAVGWRPLPWLSVGVTGQIVLTETAFSQSLYGGLAAGEDPLFEGIADLEFSSDPVFTGILGLQVMPLEWLTVGASVRPGFTVEADGTLELTFSDTATAAAGVTQNGHEATFTTEFPTVVRGGVSVTRSGFTGAADVVWEGWGRMEEMRVSPDFTVTILGVEEEVADIPIIRRWEDALSLRLGGAVELPEAFDVNVPLTVRAGYAWGQSAIPDETLNIDFVDATRHQISGGLTYDFGFLKATATASHIFQDTRTITNSEVRQAVSPPPGASYEGQVVGNGIYEASQTNLLIGLEGHFDL